MRRRLFLIEALAALTLASMLIAMLPFRWAVRVVAGRPAATPVDPRVAGTIGWALQGWAARVPWRALCFQQGLAAQIMLRRRRKAATVHYGARHDNGRLVAHVWVRSGAIDVIGCEDVGRYGLLATFPSS